MRLSEDRVKQGILHPERDVRDAAVLYFSRSFSRDQSVMPVAIHAIEKYGWEDAFSAVTAASGLALGDEAIPWIIHEFRRDDRPDNDEWAEYAHALGRMLAEADARVLSRHAFSVLSVEELDPDLHDLIAKKLDLLKVDRDTCWSELERFCENEKGTDFVDEVDLDYAYALVDALSRDGVGHADRVLSLLSQPIDSIEDNPQTWMEGFMVRLAGELRLEAAVSQIVQKAYADEEGDWLSIQCQDALIRIGTDAVVEAVAEGFSDVDWYRQMLACGVLEHVHSDLSVGKCLDLLETEEHPTIKTYLGQALNAQFAEEGIEPVRTLIRSGKVDCEFADLRSGLVSAATLIGVGFPEMEEWKAEVKEERQKRREYFARLAEESTDEEFEDDFEEENYFDDDYDGGPVGPPTTIVGKTRVGRNEPCPCGSGKKYKKCCLRKQNGDLPFS